MGIVNRYATGLLSLLDSQTQGDTPSSMGDVIAPTMDISEFMFASKRSDTLGVTVALNAVGVGALSTVPAGESWFVRSFHCEAIARDAVASTLRYAMYVTTLTNNFPVAESISAQTSVIGQGIVAISFLSRPLVMVPGDQWVIQVLSTSGVPVLGWNFNATVVYDKLTR